MSELPVLEAALLDAARRRYGRPWWHPAAMPRTTRHMLSGRAALAALAAVVVAVAVAVSDRSAPAGTDERPVGPATPWTITVDHARGFSISLPAGWALSAGTLTPQLSDPRERLSAGTFLLRFRAGECSHLPVGALRSMGPRDGFVTILERGRDPRSSRAEFPPRPRHFASAARPQLDGDLAACLHGTPGVTGYWLPFTDAGRSLYAVIVLGGEAPPAIRAQAFGILDRLRFDPTVKPGWQASG